MGTGQKKYADVSHVTCILPSLPPSHRCHSQDLEPVIYYVCSIGAQEKRLYYNVKTYRVVLLVHLAAQFYGRRGKRDLQAPRAQEVVNPVHALALDHLFLSVSERGRGGVRERI